MSINRFEEFLRERHATEYTGADDDMLDAFDKWLGLLDIDDWLNYGEWYGNKLAQETLKKQIDELERKAAPR